MDNGVGSFFCKAPIKMGKSPRGYLVCKDLSVRGGERLKVKGSRLKGGLGYASNKESHRS